MGKRIPNPIPAVNTSTAADKGARRNNGSCSQIPGMLVAAGSILDRRLPDHRRIANFGMIGGILNGKSRRKKKQQQPVIVFEWLVGPTTR
jgi:hypothetical protein